MQLNLLPKKISQQINRIQRNFVWGSSSDKKKLHLINWETLTKPKDEGGLGLQKSEVKNKALLASLAWRFHKNPDAL